MRFNKSEVTGLAAQPSHKFEKEGVLFIREKQEGFFRKTESKKHHNHFSKIVFFVFFNIFGYCLSSLRDVSRVVVQCEYFKEITFQLTFDSTYSLGLENSFNLEAVCRYEPTTLWS